MRKCNIVTQEANKLKKVMLKLFSNSTFSHFFREFFG
jgi:hypothetical protein